MSQGATYSLQKIPIRKAYIDNYAVFSVLLPSVSVSISQKKGTITYSGVLEKNILEALKIKFSLKCLKLK